MSKSAVTPSRPGASKPSRRKPKPPTPSDFASPPDAERDEFIALMGELRERNRPFYDAMRTVLRLDAPVRSSVLRLIEAASMPPPPSRPLAQAAMLLFCEICDPANEWATTAEAVAGTLDLALDRIDLGDRGRAGLVLAAALEHATDEELRDVVGALTRDRDNMHASIRERAAGGAA